MDDAPKSAGVWLSVTGLLFFGTLVTILSKSAYEVYGDGIADPVRGIPMRHTFEKPWAMVLVMFIGMTFCLLIHHLKVKKKERKMAQTASEQALLGNPAPEFQKHETSSLKKLLVLAPAVADLIATVLMNIGLVHITASVYQMLRGAELVFAAIFAIVFLKRKLNLVHLAGISLTIVGIACVGGSSLLSGAGEKKGETPQTVLLGMGLVVISQMVQAIQLTFEDYFMSDLNLEPLQVVGFEGLYGVILMLGVMMPSIYYLPGPDVGGRQENSLDSIELIRTSPVIDAIVIAQTFAMLMYNFSGMCVTDHLGAVFRAILETLRTFFVWAVDCYLFYFTSTGLGEGLNKYSLLQLAGFVILVIGTFVYDKGDMLAAKRVLEANSAMDIAEAGYIPPGGASDPMSYHAIATVPSGPIAFSPATYKSSMSINAHSLSTSMNANRFSLHASPPLNN
mmetsp:Transcript_5803/g.7837  ORF Transcript_5803/g.7837 Transcript_5803/m.7837 type:complete len:451 (+) Transcript_5803:106-1458(+)|eukprot:CAMPEP_0196588968 /NCGR_PEP_ID=MMETSP1081-20130531/62246_1 /TAXON_ID=36882 /ORGANISM="Pyramimonas amylifera, Strain CCMP720" /LENGTH=450 /DNA_ID=CAMNT_0041911625 /DNA_START=106 /DNA_END=1458 /DNA_ORIENTATION=+